MCNQCEPGQSSGERRLTAQQARRRDPTNTLMIRRQFEKDVNRRFNELKRLIKESLVQNDALGLKVNAEAAGERAFAFARSSQKVEQFMAWLRTAQNELLLQVTTGTSRGVVGNRLWANVYIESAYQKGLASAASKLEGMGVSVSTNWINNAWFRPIHADSLGLIFTRVFSDLRGITEAMDAQISRVLTQGLAEGRSSDSIARDLASRVDSIGKTRARMLARTEVVNAVSESTLNSYEEAEIEGVLLEAEFSTSGDEAVCEKCEALAKAGPYTLAQARGLIPAHPNCRCAWIPIVSNPRRVALN